MDTHLHYITKQNLQFIKLRLLQVNVMDKEQKLYGVQKENMQLEKAFQSKYIKPIILKLVK